MGVLTLGCGMVWKDMYTIWKVLDHVERDEESSEAGSVEAPALLGLPWWTLADYYFEEDGPWRIQQHRNFLTAHVSDAMFARYMTQEKERNRELSELS